jgi:hypothetical protein
MKYVISEQQLLFLVQEENSKKVALNEGRKENLRKKYLSKFKGNEKLLDIILDNQVLTDFNHKYTDFLLKNMEFDYVDTFEPTLEARIYDIELFNKYQNQLDKTDIYDYSDFNELRKELEPFVEKELEKQSIANETKKIYEDDKFLVIIPKTKNAACKYGRNTKWCVTMKDRNYYEEYTSGDQKLYYIINKKNSTHNKYSKVAVQFDNRGNRNAWDSQDIQMSDSAFGVLEYAFPEMIQAIRDDYESYGKSEVLEGLFKIFNTPQELHTGITDYFGPNSELLVYAGDFSSEENYFANGSVSVYLRVEGKIYALDHAFLFMTYDVINNETIIINSSIGDDEFEPTLDLDLRNIKIPTIKKRINFSNMSDQIKEEISEIILEQIMRTQSSLNKIVNFGIQKRKELNQ